MLQEILGVGSAMFFICDGLAGHIWVTAVFEPISPNAVARTFPLIFPPV